MKRSDKARLTYRQLVDLLIVQDDTYAEKAALVRQMAALADFAVDALKELEKGSNIYRYALNDLMELHFPSQETKEADPVEETLNALREDAA